MNMIFAQFSADAAAAGSSPLTTVTTVAEVKRVGGSWDRNFRKRAEKHFPKARTPGEAGGGVGKTSDAEGHVGEGSGWGGVGVQTGV
jgi:hypothetical protein